MRRSIASTTRALCSVEVALVPREASLGRARDVDAHEEQHEGEREEPDVRGERAWPVRNVVRAQEWETIASAALTRPQPAGMPPTRRGVGRAMP